MRITHTRQTHTSMHYVVSKIIEKRYGKFKLYLEDTSQYEVYRHVAVCFGSVLTELSLIGGSTVQIRISNELFKILSANRLKTLKSLKLVEMNIIASIMNDVCANLRQITLEWCTVIGSSLFTNKLPVTTLKLNSNSYGVNIAIFNGSFPNLENFTYIFWSGREDRIGYSVWKRFLARHGDLKSLKLSKLRKKETSSILQIASTYCKELLDLRSYFAKNERNFVTGLSSVLTFQRLTTLKISCSNQNVFKLSKGLAKLISLEVLSISSAEVNSNLVEVVSKLKHLRTLELIHCTGLKDVNNITEVKSLTNLKIHSVQTIQVDVPLIIQNMNDLTLIDMGESLLMTSKIYQSIAMAVFMRRNRKEIEIKCLVDIGLQEDPYYGSILKISRVN